MIFVTRVACPKSLDPHDPNSAGAKELAKAKALDTAPASSFYKAYSGDDVRQALNDMFKGKCAYCECSAIAGNDGDIEHYRPKGGVSDAEEAGVQHDGYWWLAMEWSNLVLSCAHCNQERRQLTLEAGATVEEIRKAIERNDRRKSGKKNRFPTDGNFWVTSDADNLATEKPLLIDPTVVDPEPLFEWVAASPFSTIKPRNGDARAEATVKVLGLNRRRLTEERGKMLTVLTLLTQNARNAMERMRDAATDAQAQVAKAEALTQLKVLKALGGPEMQFAALVKSYIKEVETMIESGV